MMVSLGKPARACRPGQKADREEIQECVRMPVCMSASASQGGGAGESAGAPGVNTNLRPYIAEVYSFANMAKYSSSPNSRYACDYSDSIKFGGPTLGMTQPLLEQQKCGTMRGLTTPG